MALTQEEMDAVVYDASEGDIDTLTEIFTELPGELLLTVKDDITGSTPIHMAAANGHIAVVEYLLSVVPKDEAKKLAAQTNDSGNTALHWAAFNGHLEVVKCLVDVYEVDPFLKNEQGHDAIYEAEQNAQAEVETWFLKKFAVENDYDLKLEENDEETKITFQPGNESRLADEEAAAKKKELEECQKNQENLREDTEKLRI